MRAAGVAAALAAGLVAAPVGIAAGQPAPPGNAQQTIAMLEADGYNVVIDRVGSAPIDQCIVTSIRNPQTITQTFWVGSGRNRDLVTVVVSRSITVSLNCAV